MSELNTEISFVIPAFNEEAHIRGVLERIKRAAREISHEIVVIDNGSFDSTAGIATEMGARVFIEPHLTISALRNLGVSQTSGEIIVFIDADVWLEDDWGDKVKPVIEELTRDPKIIAGSTYGIGPSAGWLERAWYGPVLHRGERSHLNGGHLIVSRRLFCSVGGFNENLETGEDYDFCRRAKQAGARIIHREELRVIHLGYPKTISGFFRRERWHGRGDFGSLAAMVGSIPALLSLAQLGCLILASAWALYSGSLVPLLLYAFLLLALSATAGFSRCGGINSNLLPCTVLFVLYFQARAASFFDVMKMKFGGN